MNGYFVPRIYGRPREVEALTLRQIEFVPDDEPILAEDVYPFRRFRENLGNHRNRTSRCPECASFGFCKTEDPYCAVCEWDSLLDEVEREDCCE